MSFRQVSIAVVTAAWTVVACAYDYLERDAVVMYYHTMFTSGAQAASGWNGNVAACDAGTTSGAYRDEVLRRVNFYRLLAGLPRVSLSSDVRDVDVQNAALMASANSAAHPSPPATWNCYTASGYNGAFNSIQALGASGVQAIDLYMEALGPDAASAPQRRWLLYPPQVQVATGDIPVGTRSNALWTMGPFGARPDRPAGTAWPPRGYVPWDVVPRTSKRWSMSAPGVVFAPYTLAIWETVAGTSVAHAPTVEPWTLGHGDNTIVFNLDNVAFNTAPREDRWITVLLRDDNYVAPRLFDYSVALFDAGRLPVGITADFDGDGKSDLVWHDPLTGRTSLWLVDGTGFKAGSRELMRNLAWRPTLSGDFNGDGKADLVWRNDDTGGTAIWLLDGSTYISGAIVLSDRNWRVVHVADLDGDGKADLFFEGPKGEKVAWLMDGVQQAGMRYLTGVDAVVHVADMNGDGVPDVASNHSIHLMGSVDVVASIWLAPTLDRRITHVGDFNGDGKVDFAWLNPSTGTTSIMLLNGLNVVVDQAVLTSLDWRVTAVADFDGDGKSDLLWRNAATGEIAIWKMDGTFYAGGAILLAQPDWQVHKVGSFDGDVGLAGKPKSDLLWRNTATGQHAIWLMDGYRFAGGAIVLEGTHWWATP